MSVVFESREHFLTYGYDKLLRDEARLMFARGCEAGPYDVKLAGMFDAIARKLEAAADHYLETVARERV